MRKLIVIACIVAGSGLASAGPINAQGIMPPPPSTGAAQMGSPDQHKSDWFAHAVGDILSDEDTPAATTGALPGGSAGH